MEQNQKIMNSQKIPTLVELNSSWYHNHAKLCVVFLFDLRIALTLWLCCNGITNQSPAMDLATGSKGFNILKTMLNPSNYTKVVQDFFSAHGAAAPRQCKDALFHLLCDRIYYAPQHAPIDKQIVEHIETAYSLLSELEQVGNQVNKAKPK